MKAEGRAFDFNSAAAAAVDDADNICLATTISTGTLAVKRSSH